MAIRTAALSGWIGLCVAACAGGSDGQPPPELDDEDTFGDPANDDDQNDAGDDGPASDEDGDDAADDAGDDAPPSDDGGDAADDDGGDGSTDDGGSQTDGDSGVTDECDSHAFNVASIGWVSASSVFDPWFGSPYSPELSIDDNMGSSWFSAGPEPDGTPTIYEWYVQQDHCLDTIEIVGNGDHDEVDFRQGYGYETMVVEVFDTSGSPVYTESFDLSGTPDPTVSIDLDGTLAHRVVLQLSGHEAADCGGFSELVIVGREAL
jgi:hypothetical protein